jgi:hypothetical protein
MAMDLEFRPHHLPIARLKELFAKEVRIHFTSDSSRPFDNIILLFSMVWSWRKKRGFKQSIPNSKKKPRWFYENLKQSATI